MLTARMKRDLTRLRLRDRELRVLRRRIRRVTASTRIGLIKGSPTVEAAATMGRFPLAEMIEDCEMLVRQGLLHWCADEDRLVRIACTAAGETIQ